MDGAIYLKLPFLDGSEEGSQVEFLGPDGSGMLSKIKILVPDQEMFFEHTVWMIKGHKEIDSEEALNWKGAHENYTLGPTENGTQLIVETDIAEEYLKEFHRSFPLPLLKAKDLSEAKST